MNNGTSCMKAPIYAPRALSPAFQRLASDGYDLTTNPENYSLWSESRKIFFRFLNFENLELLTFYTYIKSDHTLILIFFFDFLDSRIWNL